MTAPTLQEPSLTWGVLEFVGPDASGATFEIEAIDGTNRGNPVPIVETLPSLLDVGSLAMVTGWENRQVPIRLRIGGNDGEALSEAEAALFAQVLQDQPPPLEWTSPVGNSATSVYDTVLARLEEDTEDGWDLNEVLQGERFYTLTLTCLPFARAFDSVVVPALPVPVDPDVEDWTDVDTCGSATNWALETNGVDPTGPTATTMGGETVLRGGAVIDHVGDHLRLVRSGAFTVPDDYFLAVDVIIGGWTNGRWRARIDGIYRDPVAIAPGIGENGSTRLFFANVGTVEELAILKDFDAGGEDGETELYVFNVAHTDTIGSSTTSTLRQQSRLVTVAGSAPTRAALRVYDTNPDPLAATSGDQGDILIYTSSNAEFRPALRQWIDTSELASGDVDRVSGARHTLDTPTTFLVPANLLRQGSYALLALMDVDDAGTLSWEARMTTLGGGPTVGSGVVQSGTVDLAATTGFELVDLAAMVLPLVEVSGQNYAVELTLTGDVDMQLDEAWLFSLDDGALTWIRDTEELTWVEIRSPELGAARPSVWGGRNALGSGASCIDWKCLSFGLHRFDPDTMQIFTICTRSLEAQCEIEYFPRYFGNVRGVATS